MKPQNNATNINITWLTACRPGPGRPHIGLLSLAHGSHRGRLENSCISAGGVRLIPASNTTCNCKVRPTSWRTRAGRFEAFSLQRICCSDVPLCQAVWPACRHRHWGVSNMLLPRSRGQPCWPNPSAPSPPYTTTCRSLQIHPARWFKIQCIVAPWVTYNIAAWHLPASCLSFPQIRNLSAPEIMLACCQSWTCTAVAPPRASTFYLGPWRLPRPAPTRTQFDP